MVDKLPLFEDFEPLNEGEGFDVAEAQRRLKEKAVKNQRRYREAQKREDNYAIRKYELLLQLDKVEEKGLKIKIELQRLDKKFKKD